jgi:6-phosphogluconate dehydrogenase
MPVRRNLPAGERYDLDLRDIAELWRRGSVGDVVAPRPHRRGARQEPGARRIRRSGAGLRRGARTIQAAIDEAVRRRSRRSLFARFRSRQGHTFAEKALSAMRMGFGGHVEPKKG